MSRGGHHARVTVMLETPVGMVSGLRLDTVIMADNIVTVRENEIDSILGNLPHMNSVDKALMYSFGLDEEVKDLENERSN